MQTKSLLRKWIFLLIGSQMLMMSPVAQGEPVGAAPEPNGTIGSPPDGTSNRVPSAVISGYFDPKTNTFKAASAPAASTLVKRYGTVRFVGSVVLNASIPTSTTVSALLNFASGRNSVSKNVTLTRTNATTATVDVSIPYTWMAVSGTLPATTDIELSAYLFNSDGSYNKYWTSNSKSTATISATNGQTLSIPVQGAL